MKVRTRALGSASPLAFQVGLYRPFQRRFAIARADWEEIFSRLALPDQGLLRFVARGTR